MNICQLITSHWAIVTLMVGIMGTLFWKGLPKMLEIITNYRNQRKVVQYMAKRKSEINTDNFPTLALRPNELQSIFYESEDDIKKALEKLFEKKKIHKDHSGEYYYETK